MYSRPRSPHSRPSSPLPRPSQQFPFFISLPPASPSVPDTIRALIETLKRLLRAISTRSVPPSTSSASPPRRTFACSYCSNPAHFIKSCPFVTADIAAGYCQRNAQGKVVLPSGLFVPRTISGPDLRLRIAEYHRRFAPVHSPEPQPTFSLSTDLPRPPSPSLSEIDDDARLAALERELASLRATTSAPVSSSPVDSSPAVPSQIYSSPAPAAAASPTPVHDSPPRSSSPSFELLCAASVAVDAAPASDDDLDAPALVLTADSFALLSPAARSAIIAAKSNTARLAHSAPPPLPPAVVPSVVPPLTPAFVDKFYADLKRDFRAKFERLHHPSI
ncbi:hypothetical protein C8R46DRAFT_1287665 [Mycena filopes]|nr:hypothetical protein C8R46DRAFT_1287665 [Mycena filopes]